MERGRTSLHKVLRLQNDMSAKPTPLRLLKILGALLFTICVFCVAVLLFFASQILGLVLCTDAGCDTRGLDLMLRILLVLLYTMLFYLPALAWMYAVPTLTQKTRSLTMLILIPVVISVFLVWLFNYEPVNHILFSIVSAGR